MRNTSHRYYLHFLNLFSRVEISIQVNLPKVKYEYFDFHNECKHMKWDRISLLVDRIQEDLVREGSVLSALK